MSPLVNPLSDILPLLVGSGVAIAFVHLVDRQSVPERIPLVAKQVNDWGITIASLLIVIAAFVALCYVTFQTTVSLVTTSYYLLMLAFIFLIIAFLFPAIINTIPYLWVRYFYSQFELAQSKDIEEVKKAIAKEIEDGRKTTIE